MLQTAVLLLWLLIHWELLCEHYKITLIIAGWKGRTRSYHCCWRIFNWIIRKKRGEGELILCCVPPECLVALLPATSARYCWSSPCHCSMCACPQQGEAGVVGPVGPMVRHFKRWVDSSFYFAFVLHIIVNVKVVWFSFSFLLSRDDKECSCFRMINVLRKIIWWLHMWCCKLLTWFRI